MLKAEGAPVESRYRALDRGVGGAPTATTSRDREADLTAAARVTASR